MINTLIARVWRSASTKKVGGRVLIVVGLVAVGLLGVTTGQMVAAQDVAVAAWYPMA